MKIAFYMTSIIELGGGLEKYFVEMAVALSNLSGIHVDIITMDDKYTQKIRSLLSFYYIKKKTKENIYVESSEDIKKRLGSVHYYKIDSFKNLKRKLKAYDVIYSKNEILESLIFKFLLRYKNIPSVIFGCHTPIYYPNPQSIHAKLHNILYKSFIYKFLASGVSKFHVINSFEENYYKKIFPQKQIIKIYNPFSFENFLKNSQEEIIDFKINNKKYNILWVGRLTEQKGIDNLIYIINKINISGLKKKIVWNIVGSGPDQEKIISLQNKWDNVVYFHYVKSKQIGSLYKENNLFIMTSKWEGFPYTLLESMAFGLPTIAYNISGCNDIIDNKKTGFLVKNEEEFVKKICYFVDGGKLNNIDTKISSKFNYENKLNQLKHMFQLIVSKI